MIKVQVVSMAPVINVNLENQPKTGVEVDGSTVVVRSDGTAPVIYGHGLKLETTEQGQVLSVDTAAAAEQDNTLPISSAAVYTEVGNIDALLQTI